MQAKPTESYSHQFFQEEDSSPEEFEDAAYMGEEDHLGRLNAQYMQKMSGTPVKSNRSFSIKFDTTVRVKFFSEAASAAEVGDAQ